MQSPGGELHEKHTEQRVTSGNLTLAQAKKLYEDAKDYTNGGLRPLWEKYYKVYKGHRVHRNYEGVADPVIRESHTIIETLVANIAGGDTEFQYIPTNEEQQQDTTVLNGMLAYYLECNHMPLKTQEWVREALLYGTGILHISWANGKPVIENIPLWDFFVDPSATCLGNARYAGFEYLTSKHALDNALIYDAEKGQMVPRYKNLDKLGETKATSKQGEAQMAKEFKDMFKGSPLGDKASQDQVHVIRIYDLQTGRVIEIGNKRQIIFNGPTWCQREETTVQVQTDGPMGEVINQTKTLPAIKPFLPFAVLRDYVDSAQFYGEGEMSLLLEDNELLNDYEAMDLDNNAYQNTPMFWIDPQFADLATELETIPGAVYPIPRNAMGSIERPQLSGDLDNKKIEIVNRMRRATAADEIIQGASQNRSRTTATEVSSELSQAQIRFSTKINNLENEGFAQVGEVIYKFVQTFVSTETAVRIVGPKGIEFKDYDPAEYNGDYEVHVKLNSTIHRKKMEVGQKNNQVFEVLANDEQGVFDPVEVKRFIVQQIDPEFTDEKFNAMVAPAKPKPEADPREFLSIDYKDASPWTKYQMEQKLELTPDPQHLAEIQAEMARLANETIDHLDPTTTADGNPVAGMPNPETDLTQQEVGAIRAV